MRLDKWKSVLASHRWWVLLLLLGQLAACQATGSGLQPLRQTSVADAAIIASGGHSTHAVESSALFMHFSDMVAGERFIKFVVDVKKDQITYFNVRKYPMHTDFVFAEIYKEEISPDRLADFMSNYNEEKPDFILGYLVHHMDQDVWTFSFWEGDRTSKIYVEQAFSHMKRSFFAASRVAFRPDSMTHEDVAATLEGVPVITNDAIYKMATFQTFNPGESVGLLRVIRDEDLKDLSYAPHEIVILKTVVPDITAVSGIISEQFSTPLSHVALRARAWNVPHAGLKNATARFGHLAGKMVLLSATSTEVDLRLATAEEIARYKAQRSLKKKVLIPKANLAEQRLKSLSEVRASEVQAYGAKTANLGEIVHAKRPGIHVPPGYGVPIAFYAAHMRRHGLDERVRNLLQEAGFKEKPRVRRQKLADLRKAIRDVPLDPAVLDQLWERAAPLFASGAKGLFVRSSTNAEDLPGFNGAGLYDTVPNVTTKAALGKALRAVWASVWNLRAVEERSFHGIDHLAVYGAVLVQAGVNATAAGVLVTRNLFNPEQRGTYTINAKWGLGMKVVDGRETPEQILVQVNTGQIRVVSRSDDETMLVFDEKGGVKEVKSAVVGGAVLTEKRALALARAARELVAIFGEEPPLDIEWLFVGDELQIVQARPFVTQ